MRPERALVHSGVKDPPGNWIALPGNQNRVERRGVGETSMLYDQRVSGASGLRDAARIESVGRRQPHLLTIAR